MRTLLTLILILGLVTAVSAAPEVTVVVKPASEVAGEKVTLGDIASIKEADAEQADRLKSIGVCQSPLPGKSRKLTDDQVVTALRRAGILPESAGLLCPPEIAVVRTSAVVGGLDLIEAVRKHVLAANSWAGTVSVEAAIRPADQVVPTGKLDLRIKAGTSAVRKGRNSISVEIVIDDKVFRTVQVSVDGQGDRSGRGGIEVRRQVGADRTEQHRDPGAGDHSAPGRHIGHDARSRLDCEPADLGGIDPPQIVGLRSAGGALGRPGAGRSEQRIAQVDR